MRDAKNKKGIITRFVFEDYKRYINVGQ